jgi:hypothetical protein
MKPSVSAEPRSKRRVLMTERTKKSNAARVLTTELASRVEEDVSPRFLSYYATTSLHATSLGYSLLRLTRCPSDNNTQHVTRQ